MIVTSYDVTSVNDLIPFIKIDRPLVVYRFGIVMSVVMTSRIYGKTLAFSRKNAISK